MKLSNLNELLLTVQRPGRYIGGEWNAVMKQWDDDKTKVLLAFPDTYEVGMSHLGIKILYGLLNGRKDCLCERVFAPWIDFEDVLRRNKILLFSLESHKPMNEFDIVGFSLTYEMGYTNVLNMLDLGGIPVKSSERGDNDPLIIAGGSACCNPEPMAEFIDAFLIGDGEEAMGEIIDVYDGVIARIRGRSRENPGSRGRRRELLRAMAKVEGVYVPSLYEVKYNEDMTVSRFSTIEDGIPATIKKRYVRDLDQAFYPTSQIVPNIQVVHDRMVLEIMRGCKHACRFCQASSIYRPCRERSRKRISDLAKEAYAMTGYDEISLLSLSSGDHSHIREIIEDLNNEFSEKGVSISVPSLRIEDILKDLPLLISKVKKSGLTFAPEAGSERMRRVINKNIETQKLFETAGQSFKKGWKRVKLYFMIGLPGEEEEDLVGIAEMIKEISDLKRRIDGRQATVAASINAFVPKPHTPFQWYPMDDNETLERKRLVIKNLIRSPKIELSFHPFRMSYIEAMASRGDRMLSKVIYESWRSGARFDGWQDVFNLDIWMEAFNKCSVDHRFYVRRLRNFDEVLPWDFIDTGVRREILAKEANVLRDQLFDKTKYI